MLRRIVLNRLDAAERAIGEPLDYFRFIARTSLGAFFKFAALSPVVWSRGRVPADAYYVAMIVSCRHEDCGTCVQTVVNSARKDGVAAETIRSVLDRRPAELGPDLESVYRFACAVVEQTRDADALRDRVRDRYGDEGLVALGLAIVRARVYPTMKRTLGYATSCALVEVRL
jgi:alkylhydroperoxidase family enzyme